MNRPSKWDYASLSACSGLLGIIVAFVLISLLAGCASNPCTDNPRSFKCVYGR